MICNIGVIPTQEKYSDDEVGFWMPVRNMGPGGYSYDDGSFPLLQGVYAECRRHMHMNKLGDYLHKIEVTQIQNKV